MQISKIITVNKTAYQNLVFTTLVVQGDVAVIEVSEPQNSQIVPAHGGMGQFMLDQIKNVDPTITTQVQEQATDNKKENLELEISDFSLSEQEAIKNWLTYKKEKRQAYKPTALNTLINQIRKEKQNGCDIVAVLNISMFNNWTGLFFKNQGKSEVPYDLPDAKNGNDQEIILPA